MDFSDAVAEVLAAGGGIGMLASFIPAPYVEPGQLVPVLNRFSVERTTITRLAGKPAGKPQRQGVHLRWKRI